jgi:thiosulfate/3-mercaptopyruvate sulfurtransferase|tara:strand:- start:977 stop:2002 length:1026 start_codon:yes stop_codon:yes gene_type:complete
MNRLTRWRIFSVGVLTFVFIAWAGAATAAKWANPELLVNPDQVKKNISKADWVVVDCRNLKDYAKGHIPGAISFGKQCKKALRDSTARVFRDASWYEKFLGKVGIGNDTHVILYHGGMSTINDVGVAFWILEYLGHDNKVHVLNGGIDAWRKAGNRLDNKPVKKAATTFKAKVVSSRYGSTAEILKIATGKLRGVQLLDSRSAAEYKGKDIRAIRGGHIPNVTLNVSHKDTLAQKKNPKTGKMGPIAYFDPDVVSKKFASLDRNKRTIGYCQTGTRSSMTYLQLRLLGFKDPANWDESWRVYGSQLDYPVAGEQWYNFASVNKKIKKLEKKVKKLEASKKK